MKTTRGGWKLQHVEDLRFFRYTSQSQESTYTKTYIPVYTQTHALFRGRKRSPLTLQPRGFYIQASGNCCFSSGPELKPRISTKEENRDKKAHSFTSGFAGICFFKLLPVSYLCLRLTWHDSPVMTCLHDMLHNYSSSISPRLLFSLFPTCASVPYYPNIFLPVSHTLLQFYSVFIILFYH